MSSSRVVQTTLPYQGFEAKAKVVNTFNKEKVLVIFFTKYCENRCISMSKWKNSILDIGLVLCPERLVQCGVTGVALPGNCHCETFHFNYMSS